MKWVTTLFEAFFRVLLPMLLPSVKEHRERIRVRDADGTDELTERLRSRVERHWGLR